MYCDRCKLLHFCSFIKKNHSSEYVNWTICFVFLQLAHGSFSCFTFTMHSQPYTNIVNGGDTSRHGNVLDVCVCLPNIQRKSVESICVWCARECVSVSATTRPLFFFCCIPAFDVSFTLVFVSHSHFLSIPSFLHVRKKCL